MNAQQHYATAERLLITSDEVDIEDGHAQLVATQALVHATLAMAARPVVVIAADADPEILRALSEAMNIDPSKEVSHDE
ncbi:hypothetical protein GCM10007304_17910 [Rhodococcoides trifolii]|uniref:Uncharacterized protein n=1 Tax=Rhodococcoides trifolii TaxID=908250 RepID=A0A917CYA5_9NOCA|nr:hypothetical protein [Rhodococcus trifolii]GGG04223.1 hypothetical protein GCM10007304_17910 [Rhodococcus trifolii]